MNAQRQVASHTQNMVTGKRINSASDDAANAGVVVNLSAQKSSTRMALRNIADGMSIMSTVEEATSQVAEKVKRMRELAIQGSSEILQNPERKYLQKEMQALQDEMNDVAAKTNFNGISLTDGSKSTITLQMGANNSADDRLKMRLHELTVSAVFGGGLVGVKSVADSQNSINNIDKGMDKLGSFRSGFGANQNVLSAATGQSERYAQNMGAAESRVEDADYAHQAAQLARAQMILQSSVAVRAQTKIEDQAVLAMIRG
jgi:flagellin